MTRGVAPEGKHVMSVFAQYAPYELRRGRTGSGAAGRSAS